MVRIMRTHSFILSKSVDLLGSMTCRVEKIWCILIPISQIILKVLISSNLKLDFVFLPLDVVTIEICFSRVLWIRFLLLIKGGTTVSALLSMQSGLAMPCQSFNFLAKLRIDEFFKVGSSFWFFRLQQKYFRFLRVAEKQ